MGVDEGVLVQVLYFGCFNMGLEVGCLGCWIYGWGLFVNQRGVVGFEYVSLKQLKLFFNC